MNNAELTTQPRLIVAVGRQQERRILEACRGDRGLRVVGRCNSALELVRRVELEHADVLLVDDDLHLLDADRLDDLTRRRRLRVVLLAHDPDVALEEDTVLAVDTAGAGRLSQYRELAHELVDAGSP